ncbi:Long-chain-alcohol oxidase FAO4A [Linum grandiflorum]
MTMIMQRRDDKEEQTVVIDLKPTVAGDGDNNSDRLMTTVSNDKTVTISEREMESLTCICDTFFPSINHRHESAVVAEFYQTSASMAGTPERIGRLIGGRLKHPKIWLVRLALWLLSTRIGTLILCGRLSISSSFPFLLSFPEIPLQKRERIVLSWSQSLFFHLRMLFKAFKLLIPLVFFSQVNEKNENLTWEAIGYPGSDPAHKAEQQHPPNEPLAAAKEHPCGPLDKGIINMHLPRSTVADSLQRSGFQVSATAGTINIKCDAVVVGSGSGGGVVAGMLANAGYKVLVLEKGTYLARSNLSLLEGPSMDQMYLQGGLLATDDMSFVVLAGSTVGGGSAINWSASIKTPHKVTQEWSHEHQLELFDTKMYREAMEVVCQKMGVHTRIEVEEGLNNTVLRKGCQRLGYPVEDIPRNADAKHSCGWCCFGCKEGRKLATSETWLVDLVNSGNGVILPGCEAVRVMHQSKNGRKIATGVVFESITKEICVVESKVTVVACGALSTPPLLRRSGLKNRHIGKNLHLHPVTMAWGYFNEEVLKQKSYQGPIITAMTKVTEDESEDDGLYGAIIQTPSLHPGMFSSFMPWVSGSDLKRRMTRFSRTAHMFTLARDRGSGAVGDSSNSISYKMGESDERNLQKGVEKMLRILAAAGAEEIGTHNLGGRSINVKEVGEEELERFVKEESKKPIRGLRTQLGSAHQMGSCRMGVDPAVSAVKESGETWEVEGLYVADSSVFPTAVGVNPMVTVQAIAYCTALSVLERLRRKKLCSEF